MKRTAVIFYASCLALTLGFAVWQILAVRYDWLYPAICAGFILAGVADLLLRRPPKTLLWVLLCLFYLKLPMVWCDSTGSTSWLWYTKFLYVPVGCMVYCAARLRALLRPVFGKGSDSVETAG